MPIVRYLKLMGEQYHVYIGSIAKWAACTNNMVYIRDNIIAELWDAAATIYNWIMSTTKWTSCQNGTSYE